MILTSIKNVDGSVRYVKVFIRGDSDHRALRHNRSITGYHVRTYLSEEAERWLADNGIEHNASPTFADSFELIFQREVDAVAFKLWFA